MQDVNTSRSATNMPEPKWIAAAHVELVSNGAPFAWVDITQKAHLFEGFEIPAHCLKVTSTADEFLVSYRGFDNNNETIECFPLSELGSVEVWTIEGRYGVWPKLLPLFPLNGDSNV